MYFYVTIMSFQVHNYRIIILK